MYAFVYARLERVLKLLAYFICCNMDIILRGVTWSCGV